MVMISDNLAFVRERIALAAAQSGRTADDITLVAVTKTFPPETIRQGIEAGITIIGENWVQEALEKHPAIGNAVSWHLIGHLQSNKAKKAVEIFSLIHSVDSAALAQEIGRRAGTLGKVQDILIEVNTSGEGQKFGLMPDEGNILKAVAEIKKIKGIKILGLMTVGPLTGDERRIRESFQTLRRLFDRLRSENLPNVEMRYLSMGMSGDFEAAIEEGSTMVRVGSAIFGSRR
ncbi:MAG: YggS family pyridoxal phosphate-dependent enzyme [Candidatus Edwardsbacteria bacterium]|nr:YggS family pyridoxal phosphate-dependent enzyme [Candidatus Edwardsbacteria bacterium]